MIEPIHQSRAGLARLPIDQHGARAADLLEAAAVITGGVVSIPSIVRG